MRIIKRCADVALLIVLSVMAVSCMDKSLNGPEDVKPIEEKTVKASNSFDFSTVQNVNLKVDYSSFKTYGPVFFSVYAENPFVGEEEEEHLDENITPIFEDYTNAKGLFSMTIQLPAYAEHLYIVTGNFFVSQNLIEAEIENGYAEAVAKNPHSARTRAAAVISKGADILSSNSGQNAVKYSSVSIGATSKNHCL